MSNRLTSVIGSTGRPCPRAPELVGDPVDVVTGAVVDEMWDFVFRSPLRVEWWRAYDSRWFEQDRGLGLGFRHSYEHWLVFDLDGVTYRHPRGYETHFPHFTSDGQRELRGGYALERADEQTYVLRRRDQPTRRFYRAAPHAPEARLEELIDERVEGEGGRVALQYEGAERARLDKILARTALGHDETFKVEWNTAGQIARVVLWSHDGDRTPFITYRYDERGRLIEATDMYKQRCCYEYTRHDRLSRKTDRRGYSFFFAYNPDGRCTESRGEDGTLAVQLRYEPQQYETTVLDANGAEWLYQYRPNGVLTFRTDPYGNKHFWKYGADGRLLCEYDEVGCETRYLHDEAGAPIAKILPDGRRVSLPESDEPDGHRVPGSPLEYELGDLVPMGFGLPDPFEPLPDLPQAVRASLATSDDPLRGTIRQVRDAQGLLLREELEDGRTRTYAYTENGQLRRLTDFDGHTSQREHESWNHLVRAVDGAGNVTSYEYSATEKQLAVVDPSGTRTEYGWDLKDRLVQVSREGPVRESYTYDAADRLIEKRDANGDLVLSLDWDRLGHMVSRRLQVGEDQHFRYDAHGRVVEAFTENFRCSFAYDWRGRRTRDERDGRGVRHRFAGDHLAETVVFDRFRTEYRHLPNGVLVVVDPTGEMHRVRRHGRGVVTRDFANGLSETTQFHPRGGKVLRRILFDRATGVPQRERRFTYSGEGDLLEVRDSDVGLTRYEHDAAHRLHRAYQPDGSVDEYLYNDAGALYQSPTLGQATIGGGNQLRYANGERFELGQRHHVSQRVRDVGELTYDYDSRDQLAVAFWQGANGVTWGWDAEYDPLGRRIRKSPGYSAHHRYYWDTDRLAAEVLPDGRCRVYVYPDAFALMPMLFIDYESVDADPASGQRYYVLTDQRCCVERVLDDRGADVWRARLDPYGFARVEVGADFHQPLRFPGHWYDPELGLHYNRFRYYDPALGRYLQTDPWGLRGEGPNLYAYTYNPLTQVDPRGLGCDDDPPPADGEPEGGPDRESTAQRRSRINRDRGLDSEGLTPDQRLEFDRIRNEEGIWAARRYRYERSRENWGEPVRDEARWRSDAERVHANQERGTEREGRAREGLAEHLGRDLEDSNAAGTTHEENGTRPDSVGRDPDGNIDLVHDHKDLSGQSDVQYDTEQMSRQRGLLETDDGRHVVTLSSDTPALDGSPPRPRPSGPLGENSTVYYTDAETGAITHEWSQDAATGQWGWEEI